MISSNYNSGFQLTFENGIMISVQFSPNSYCEHHYTVTPTVSSDTPQYNHIWNSKDAEIALIDTDSKQWFNFDEEEWTEYSDVKGYCSPDEIARWIIFAKTCKTKTARLLYDKNIK